MNFQKYCTLGIINIMFVEPNRSLLELGLIDQVYEACMRTFGSHVAEVWDDCARMSTAFFPVDGIEWKPAS
jgi:hypothetical protein